MDKFLTAAAAADDERAEALCPQLQSTDEPHLLPLTRHENVDLRWWSVRALAQCGSAAAVDALNEALQDADSGVRAVASRALAQLHERFAEVVQPQLPQIAQLLADADGLVCQSAADSLALCGDHAVPVLSAVLDGVAIEGTDIVIRNEGARSWAARALHKIATIASAPALYRHLEDPNHLVRTHAYEALDEMGLLENNLVTLS